MKIWPAILLSLFLVLLQVFHTGAQPPRHGGRRGDPPPDRLPEDQRLTAEQIEKIRSIQHRYLEDIHALRNDLLNRRYRFRGLLLDPASDGVEIKSKQKEVFALENQIQERMLDYQLEVRDILTPEQFRHWVSRQGMPFGHEMHHMGGMGMMHMRGMGMMHQ